jgi:hypothetical protein
MRLHVSLLVCLGGISTVWAAAGLPPTLDSNPPDRPTSTRIIRGSKPPPLTREEKELLAAGYTLEIRGNENFFCHQEVKPGTKFSSRVCKTSETIKIFRQISRDAADSAQQKGLQSGNGR